MKVAKIMENRNTLRKKEKKMFSSGKVEIPAIPLNVAF